LSFPTPYGIADLLAAWTSLTPAQRNQPGIDRYSDNSLPHHDERSLIQDLDRPVIAWSASLG
ncbi:MAG TPA: hypothetical protein VF920_09415, partial [Dongiaceae bacterium]